MAAETKDTGFIIDGTRYPVPTIDDFTLSEAQVLYDYCKLTLEDFALLDVQDIDEEITLAILEKVKNPGFVRALLHIAYQRANPQMSEKRIKEAVGSADLIENYAAVTIAGEDDARPPDEESMNKPSESSTRTSPDSNDSGGSDSSESSVEPEMSPEATTTTGSDTSLASVLATSET